MQYFMGGLGSGTTTVFLPQLRKEANSTGVIDDDDGSWLYSVPYISVFPWIIISPLFTKKVGRKIPQIVASISAMIGFIVLYCTTSVYHIMVTHIILAYLNSGNLTFTIQTITEYSSPRLRGLFLTVTAAGFYWGMWVANAIGTFFHSRNIALVGICSSIYLLTILFWPESPYWLASKGRLEESRVSFRWIHGLKKEKELQEMFLTQDRNHILEEAEDKMSLSSTLRCPEFYRPLILSTMVIFQCLFSGKMVCCLYILDIFKTITSSEEAAYRAMLILDAATLFCIYVGSYLATILSHRTLYMSTSFVAVFFLFSTSLYLFLVRLKLFEVNNYITLALLTIFSVSISVGPIILNNVIYVELIPSKFQTSCYTIIALMIALTYFIWLKITPNIFTALGLDGSFLLYGILCGLCTVYLYVYLPETKDKTRFEIDNLFVKKKSSTDEKAMRTDDDETTKSLVEG